MSYTIDVRGGHALVIVAACGGGTTQADAPIDVVARRCDPAAPFKAPVPLPTLESDHDDVCARLTADELTIVFARRNNDMTYDLYMSTRARIEDAFAAPQILGAVNSIYSDVWPAISADGTSLYFDSDRLVPGTFHVWVSRRASPVAPWGPPTEEMGLLDGDFHSYLTTDGRALYFASAMRMGAGASDIFRAQRDAAGVLALPVAVVGGVDTTANEIAPAVTADELHIFFERDGTDGDVFTASRSAITDGFGVATPVDGLDVAGVTEGPTWVSPDGCHLYFHSTAPGGAGGVDLYVATRE
jgi:WD40 repeat protein